MDASEMFMNVVARQDLILEQMGKTEKKWSDKLRGIEANQKSVCDDLKTLNECFGILKKDILDHVNSRIDELVKKISLNNPSRNPNNQDGLCNPPLKKKVLLVGDSLSRKSQPLCSTKCN